jgi:ABC-type Mn2+/Zn2+ transport system ATPase subunit
MTSPRSAPDRLDEGGGQGPHAAGATVTADRLSVAFGGHPALSEVCFALTGGTFTGVLGPNGAGKTTLLRALLGLVAATGETTLRGRAAYVPQLATVSEAFPIDALGVVIMGRYPRLGWRRRPGRGDRRLAADLLEQVGLADRARSPFGALSGGQRQRVLMARALAQEGDVLLLDEPLTGIDAPSQSTMLDVIGAQRAQGKTVVMTTHDLGQAARECDRLLLLNRTVIGDGTAAEVLTPEVLGRAYEAQVVMLDGGAALIDEGVHHHPSRRGAG